MEAVETLKKRSEFLRIRGGARWATPAFVLEAKPRTPGRARTVFGAESDVARFGFTATKKLGSAVVRNRIRRRLKAAVDALAPRCARSNCDYVLVARSSAETRSFASLCGDLEQAFIRVNRVMSSMDGRGSSKRPRGPVS
ncbi:Ribonuclease P protein component [Candidatus Filomicrobium marinum]|uniref:Ribonuclease P protein component n=1 Tax=Candidatus Filomicrobium marinum TaxID=1608628 RepID=A0A0D6JCU9_9HYPH|nr:Ribonuclease P protein component [Candidatus Filomicrobium marinum]CPR16783.1 Ribonuclease P protein component [Candidatus Filomicrobium marinum]